MKHNNIKRVVFISTDNNASSGAFISMLVLNEYLNKEYAIETEIILPKKGTGTVLLEERKIKYRIIRSYDWLVPISIKNKISTKCISFLKKTLNIISVKRIRKELKRVQADLVHINTIYGYVGAIAAHKESIPIVWHFREIIEKGHDKTFANREFSLKILNYADAIVAVSCSVLRYYQNIGIKMNNASVIYNGIDVSSFYNPNKVIFTEEKVRILFVGDFSRNKGAFNLIKALEIIRDKNAIQFIVSFVGNSNEEFDKLLKNCKIKNQIKVFGYQKNVSDFYKENDIVVTGAKYEAFGRVTAEAMLSGCLVITTNDSGSGELVKSGVTGYSYSYDKPDMLADQIEYAIIHKEESKKIAKKGQFFIKNNMTARQNAQKIVLLYNELCN